MQSCKNLFINAFIGWRFVQWSELNVVSGFKNLDHLRTSLNDIASLGDFVSIAVRELIQHGTTLFADIATYQALSGGGFGRGASLVTIRRLT